MRIILNSSIFLYFILFAALSFLMDDSRALFYRLNNLVTFQSSPIDQAQGKKVGGQLPFYLAMSYYQTYARIVQGYRFKKAFHLPQLGFNKPSRVLLEAMSSSGRAEEMLAYCAFYVEDFHFGQEILERLTKEFPHRFWLKYNLAVFKYREGSMQEALELFKSITIEDVNGQLQGAVLSPLNNKGENRAQYFGLLPNFVQNVRTKSLMGIMHIQDDHGIKVKNAQARLSLTQLQAIGFEPVMHPWSFYIPPGNEFFYN